MALRPSPDAADIGPVEADESGRVVRITSVVPSEDGRPGTHFTGVHAMSRAAVELIRMRARAVSSAQPIGSWFLPAESATRSTAARGSMWAPRSLSAASLAVLDGEVNTPIDPWTRGVRTPDGSWIERALRLRVASSTASSVTVHGCPRRSPHRMRGLGRRHGAGGIVRTRRHLRRRRGAESRLQ